MEAALHVGLKINLVMALISWWRCHDFLLEILPQLLPLVGENWIAYMQLTFVVPTCSPQQVACVVNKYITMATETIFVYQQWRVRLISQVNKRGACRATKWAECAYICWVFTEFNSCLHSEDVVLYTHRRKKRQQANEHILALIRHENELIHSSLHSILSHFGLLVGKFFF